MYSTLSLVQITERFRSSEVYRYLLKLTGFFSKKKKVSSSNISLNHLFCLVFLVALSSQVMVPDNYIIIHTYLVTMMTKFPGGTPLLFWWGGGELWNYIVPVYGYNGSWTASFTCSDFLLWSYWWNKLHPPCNCLSNWNKTTFPSIMFVVKINLISCSCVHFFFIVQGCTVWNLHITTPVRPLPASLSVYLVSTQTKTKSVWFICTYVCVCAMKSQKAIMQLLIFMWLKKIKKNQIAMTRWNNRQLSPFS